MRFVPGRLLLGGLVLIGGIHAPGVYAATYSGGSGTSGDPYLISTSQDLLDLANPANSADWDKHFLMTHDIDMSAVTGFTPIAPDTDAGDFYHQGTTFRGVFDGGGHAIQDLTIDLPDQDYVGLFGYIDGSGGAGSGEISNLGLDGGSASGREYVGGLVCGFAVFLQHLVAY